MKIYNLINSALRAPSPEHGYLVELFSTDEDGESISEGYSWFSGEVWDGQIAECESQLGLNLHVEVIKSTSDT